MKPENEGGRPSTTQYLVEWYDLGLPFYLNSIDDLETFQCHPFFNILSFDFS